MAFNVFVWTMISLWGVCEIQSLRGRIEQYWPIGIAAIAQVGVTGWAIVNGALALAGLAALLGAACAKVTWDEWNDRN
jgi:hypothetical protein